MINRFFFIVLIQLQQLHYIIWKLGGILAKNWKDEILSSMVSRNPETGVSRGCGYITMSSIESATNAVSALDGSLRNLFSQFGVVDSARVLYDRRGGKNPTYAFLSFSSAAERDAALSMNGTVKAH
uniref:RRM domain-containing protein n=1 Tax=Populus trichocarpa TaxID=3694 RepID=A0A2K2BKI8_POPTR